MENVYTIEITWLNARDDLW